MIRWLAALLLLTVSPAHATLLHKARDTCPQSDGARSEIFPPTSCTLRTEGHTWSFGALSRDGKNYDLYADGSPLAKGDAAAIGDLGNFYWRTGWATCGSLWQEWEFHASYFVQAPNRPALMEFTDTTNGHKAGSWGQLFYRGVSSGDAVRILPAPSAHGFYCWPQIISFATNNLTITATGAKFADASSSKGIVVVGDDHGGGSGTTLNGGDYNGALRIAEGAKGVTIENATFHSNCGTVETSCILAGSDFATLALINDTVYDGGDSATGGQDHNVYISASPASDPAANVQISGLVDYNVVAGGWTLKMRPQGAKQNRVTRSIIGCTRSSVSNNVCEQNGVIDMPCGGDYKIDYSTLERGPHGDNGYVVRALEESRYGTRGRTCPSSYAPKNQIVLDHDIIVWDGPSPGWAVTNVVCIAANDGAGNCQKGPPPGGTAYQYSCTITHSVIVSDSASGVTLAPGAGCHGSGGEPVCSDGTNRCYPNRTVAAAREGWASKDQFGNPCCAFPYLPPHP